MVNSLIVHYGWQPRFDDPMNQGAPGPDSRTWECAQIPAAHASLRHLDLIEQIWMAIQHFEQLDEG